MVLSEPTTDFGKALKVEAEAKTGGLKAIVTDRSDLFRINPYSIVVRDGWNGRDMRDPDNQEHVAQLARSIAAIGVQEPLTIYMDGGKPTLTNGHCRLLAVLQAIENGAEIKSIPVKTEPRGANEPDRVLSQITRNSGKRLTPLEQGLVFKRLMALGWNEADIAAKTGVQVGLLRQYVDLHSAPESVVELVATGKISATLASQTLQEHGDEGAAKLLTTAVAAATAAGKAKATASTVTAVATGAKPDRKKNKETPVAPAAVFDMVAKVLKDLLTHMPEFEAEDNPPLDRAYRAAVNLIAQLEGDS